MQQMRLVISQVTDGSGDSQLVSVNQLFLILHCFGPQLMCRLRIIVLSEGTRLPDTDGCGLLDVPRVELLTIRKLCMDVTHMCKGVVGFVCVSIVSLFVIYELCITEKSSLIVL